MSNGEADQLVIYKSTRGTLGNLNTDLLSDAMRIAGYSPSAKLNQSKGMVGEVAARDFVTREYRGAAKEVPVMLRGTTPILDGVFETAKGEFVVVEAKANSAQLGRTNRKVFKGGSRGGLRKAKLHRDVVQFSPVWFEQRLAELRRHSPEGGRLANRLEHAWQNGKLRPLIVRAPEAGMTAERVIVEDRSAQWNAHVGAENRHTLPTHNVKPQAITDPARLIDRPPDTRPTNVERGLETVEKSRPHAEPHLPKLGASTAAHVAESSVNAAERSSRLRSLKIGLKAWRAARVVGKVLITCFVPLKALDIVLEIAMAIWDHERAKAEQKEQEKQRTLEAVFKQGAPTIEKGIQAIVSSGATVQGFMDAWERSTRHTGFHYARLRAVVEVQSFRGLASGRIETIDSMTTYRLVSLNVKATSAFHDFEIEEHGEEKEVEKTDKEKVALYLKGHSSSDLFRKTLRNRSLGYTIVPPLHTPFDVVVTKINNLFVDVTTVITGITGSADAWLDGFQSFNFARGWKEQFDLEPQFTAPLNPPVCEFCLSYLFASAKVLSRHPLEPQDVEGNLEDPRKGYGRRFDLLATRVDHDRAPYNKNFSDFVGQIGKLVKSGRADADMAAAVEKLQVGARSIWNDLRRIEDNIKNPEYYYLGPNYKPAR